MRDVHVGERLRNLKFLKQPQNIFLIRAIEIRKRLIKDQ